MSLYGTLLITQSVPEPFTALPATPEANSGGSAAFEGKCDGTPASVLARLANRGIWSDLSDSSLAFSVYVADERKIKGTNNIGLPYIVKLGAQHLGAEQLTASRPNVTSDVGEGNIIYLQQFSMLSSTFT